MSKSIFLKLKQNKFHFGFIICFFFFIGICVALSIPKEYKSISIIAVEDSNESKGDNLGTLASMAGVSLKQNTKDALTPKMYPAIISSTPFLLELLNTDVLLKNKISCKPLSEYLKHDIAYPWWNYILSFPSFILNKQLVDDLSQNENDFREITYDEKRHIKILLERIFLDENKKDGTIVIGCIMQDPLVSSTVTSYLIRYLESYITEYKTKKAQNDLEFADSMCSKAQNDYYQALMKYNDYIDKNKNIISASYSVEKTRLENEVSIYFSVYQSASTQLETAKINLQKQTPIIVEIEPPIVPLFPVSPSRVLIVLFISFLGFIFAVFFIFRKELYNLVKSKISSNLK